MSVRKSIRKPWSNEEDAILLQLINKYGTSGCWPKIAMQMESRTGKQCRERYINHLDPDMKKCAWSDEEDNIIRNLYPELGTKWSQYMPALVGRSDNAIKNRFHVISRNNFGKDKDSSIVSESFVSCGVKRSADDMTSSESDNDHEEESSLLEVHQQQQLRLQEAVESRKRLKSLRAARSQLDRQILALEAQQRVFAEDMLSSHPSPHSELTCENDLLTDLEDWTSFNWDACDHSLLSGCASSEASQEQICQAEELLSATFDLSCYEIAC